MRCYSRIVSVSHIFNQFLKNHGDKKLSCASKVDHISRCNSCSDRVAKKCYCLDQCPDYSWSKVSHITFCQEGISNEH